MRALTIRQPWAWAILHGHKTIENRKKPPPASMIGQTFAIHSAQKFDEADYLDCAKQLPGKKIPEALPVSSLIATAKLLGSFTVGDPVEAFALPDDWASGPFCYVLGDIAPAPVELMASGQLGFWALPEEIEAKILAWMKKPLETRWSAWLADEAKYL